MSAALATDGHDDDVTVRRRARWQHGQQSRSDVRNRRPMPSLRRFSAAGGRKLPPGPCEPVLGAWGGMAH
jgi:hypothetical protein